MPGGRPSSFRPEFPALARNYCLLGATNEKLAELFGVAGATIDKWIKEKPEFSGAIKEGRDIADARVGQALYERATGYSHKAVKLFQFEGAIVEGEYIEHYPPDATSMIFWLKNRRPDLWREKSETTVTVTNDRRAIREEIDAVLGAYDRRGQKLLSPDIVGELRETRETGLH